MTQFFLCNNQDCIYIFPFPFFLIPPPPTSLTVLTIYLGQFDLCQLLFGFIKNKNNKVTLSYTPISLTNISYRLELFLLNKSWPWIYRIADGTKRVFRVSKIVHEIKLFCLSHSKIWKKPWYIFCLGLKLLLFRPKIKFLL